MNKSGLTLTMIFEAQSANYGEGIANISQLKKMTRSDGRQYTYISRQAMRYNMMQQIGCDNTPVEDAGVVQFAPSAKIDAYPEIDLFGYMKTSSKDETKGKGTQKIRSAVVRLSNAVSLEPYNLDMDFLTNMGLAKRKEGLENAIAQSEIHNAMYAYTIAIDLDRIGIDENDGIEIDPAEKAKRVVDFLGIVEFLYRDIKGRRENLAPIFAIGGVYARKNPYFEGRVELDKNGLKVETLRQVIESDADIKDNTRIGVLSGKFANGSEIDTLGAESVHAVFEALKKEAAAYYA